MDDLDIDPALQEAIQERVKAKLDANLVHTKRAVAFALGLFHKVYEHCARTANVTSDSLRVFLKLFSATDKNGMRLVKSKMANIFKPSFRRQILKNAQGSSIGIFGGDSNVFKHMEESKKQSALVKSILLQTNKKQGKSGKPGAKGGNNKKPAAKKGSKGKNAKRRQNAA